MFALFSRMIRLILAKDPLFFAGCFAVVGICAAHFTNCPSWVWGLAAAGFLALSPFFSGFRAVLLFCAALAGFGGWHQYRKVGATHLDRMWVGRAPHESLEVSLAGTIVEQPFVTRMGDRALLTIRLEHLKRGGALLRTRDRIRTWASSGFSQGDRIEAEGVLTQIPSPRNPGEFSRREYARNTNGVVAELRLSSHHRIRVVGESRRYRVFDHALQARRWVGRAITRGLPRDLPQAGLLRAMVLGARSEAHPGAEEPFRLSGALHIFAVSGLHVGIFGMVVWMLLRSMKVPRRAAIVAILGCVLGYAFITGLRPSAVRAALMASVFLAGFWFRRQPRLLNSLGIAALLIFVFDTRQLFTVGFQLSFCVLTAIALFGPLIRTQLHRLIDPDPFIPRSLVGPWHGLGIVAGHGVADVFAISAAAWLGSLPLIWWYFGLITPVAVLANCFLVPIAWLVICFATVSMVAGGVKLFFVAAWLNQLNAWLVLTLQQTATFFALIPGGHFQVTPLSDLVSRNPPDTGMIVFDLGRSSCPQAFHVRDSPAGGSLTWLIDCGGENGYAFVVRPWLRQQGIRRLDGFIATHGDTTHTGAAPELIAEFRPHQVVTSQLPSMSQAYRNLEAVKASQDISSIQIASGTGIQLGGQAEIDVLYPPSHHPDLSMSDDECLVLRMEWAGFRILLMSDSGFVTEKWLLANVPDLSADVLVKSHHVSDFSGLEEFVAAVAPQAIISTNDRFPVNQAILPKWREWIEKREIDLLDQAETGAVTIEVRDGRLVLRGFVNGQELRLSPRAD